MQEKEKMEKLKADQLKDKQNKLQSQMIEEA
jgi:colicin import membrane protein